MQQPNLNHVIILSAILVSQLVGLFCLFSIGDIFLRRIKQCLIKDLVCFCIDSLVNFLLKDAIKRNN